MSTWNADSEDSTNVGTAASKTVISLPQTVLRSTAPRGFWQPQAGPFDVLVNGAERSLGRSPQHPAGVWASAGKAFREPYRLGLLPGRVTAQLSA